MTSTTNVAALFAGIGGLEYGLKASGFETEFFCEINPHAQCILRKQFPGSQIEPDVTKLRSIPRVELLTAGFPCQDLSQAGEKLGINGEQSGLISHLLRLVRDANQKPRWILIENVYYMLRLNQGRAMQFMTTALEELGYRWAYRVVDARSFGVPQRRLRVILLASREGDPRTVLFADNVSDSSVVSQRLQDPLVIDTCGPKSVEMTASKSYGFYWTEGRIGIGWAVDAVPAIKGGSGLGIPSPPAVWYPTTNELGVPALHDGERLQGFPGGWTEAEFESSRSAGIRWKLIGNAVCTAVSKWVGQRLISPGDHDSKTEAEFHSCAWPLAAHGWNGKRRAVRVSAWPLNSNGPALKAFLDKPLKPLSKRAAAGFLSRAKLTPKIVYAPQFLAAIQRYVNACDS